MKVWAIITSIYNGDFNDFQRTVYVNRFYQTFNRAIHGIEHFCIATNKRVVINKHGPVSGKYFQIGIQTSNLNKISQCENHGTNFRVNF